MPKADGTPLESLENLVGDKGDKVNPFDGDKHTANIPAYGPLGQCKHKNVVYENGPQGNCLRCSCGVVFVGPNLAELYTLLTS